MLPRKETGIGQMTEVLTTYAPLPLGGEPGDQGPFLLMDLQRVATCLARVVDALSGASVHYAVKCNPALPVLDLLHAKNCGFEIASLAELEALREVGVDPATVIFSNPVKSAEQIRLAREAGVWRFAFDGSEELSKLQTYAPHSSVYARIAVPLLGSGVPSEGKFGVDDDHAVALLLEAAARGLKPHGLSFHVGSQMTDPRAWDSAIQHAGEVMKRLDQHGVRLSMLDVGGGFPVRYDKQVPALSAIGTTITAAANSYLPYEVELIAEPGRAIVAEAGTFVTTVVGSAIRHGSQWLHLDVGAFNGLMEALESRNSLRYPMADSLGSKETTTYHVTGPTCDSQDTILYDVELSAGLKSGDNVYIGMAGAYTLSYASSFNGFPVPVSRYV